MTIPVPAWLAEMRAAADRDFEANPGSPLPPELAARFRRVLPPPPGEAQAA